MDSHHPLSNLTLWSPWDGPQIVAELLSRMEDAAQSEATFYFSMYSFTLQELVPIMTELGRNPASIFVFDKSETEDKYQQAVVRSLISHLQPHQWGVGTSPEDGQILHSKIATAIYPNGTAWTFAGSFNLSEAAQKEFNIAQFTGDVILAQTMKQKISEILTSVQAQEQFAPFAEFYTQHTTS